MIYIIERADGRVEEVVWTVKELEKRMFKDGSVHLDDGSVGKRRFDLEHAGAAGRPDLWLAGNQDNWACSVHPSQIPAAVEAANKAGVPTSFSRDGSPQFTSAKHRREYLKSRGMIDRSSY